MEAHQRGGDTRPNGLAKSSRPSRFDRNPFKAEGSARSSRTNRLWDGQSLVAQNTPRVLHRAGSAFTWWAWRPSPAIQLWINHAECEYLPQGKKKKNPMTVCVCEGDRQKVTSYVTARTEFPGNLLEEASEQFLVAVATFCRAPESFGVCAAPPRTRKKKKDNAILSRSCLYGWCQNFLAVWHWKWQLVFLSKMRRYSYMRIRYLDRQIL